MKTFENLEQIIRDGKLISFVLGEDEFLTKRPEVDYRRWKTLQDFYRKLDPASPLRNVIDNTIEALFDYESEQAKYTSIAIGRILKLPTIIEKIKDTILNSEVKDFGKNLQNEIYFSAIILQIPETAPMILKLFIDEGRLGEYLLCSSIPPHVQDVGTDDIWRLSVLDEFFVNSSQVVRNSISKQVNETALYSHNFRLAIRKYLEMFPDTKFRNVLEDALFHQKNDT